MDNSLHKIEIKKVILIAGEEDFVIILMVDQDKTFGWCGGGAIDTSS